MSNEHTPTPWKWQKFGRSWILVGDHGITPFVLNIGDQQNAVRDVKHDVMRPFNPEHPDAEFIVTAVNAHKDLVAALCAIDAHWSAGNFSRESTLWDQMRAALRKANA